MVAGYEWKMPCYALASAFNQDHETGSLVIDTTLRLWTPTISGEDHVAIYGNKELATQMIAKLELRLTLLALTSIKQLVLLLAVYSDRRHVIFDLELGVGGRRFEIQSILKEISELKHE